MSEASTRKLMEDLRTVVADAEALLSATAHDASEKARDARERATGSVEQARKRLEELEEDLRKRAQAAADDAGRYVKDNPWQSIGIAAAVGVVVGLILGRR
ncbi:MAG TPA: DUF883 family protein [Steroidobacteraceae bacterium]|nr:DUF883 family protein [Steroidobacteraceae bacterium]